MTRLKLALACALAFTLMFMGAMAAEPAPASDTEELKQMVDSLQKRIKAVSSSNESTPVAEVESAVADKLGDGQPITTHTGRLTVGGLMQVWYQHIQNDSLGITQHSPGHNGLTNFNNEPGERLDNDTFRVRRMELRFGMELTENIFAYVMIDPSREANSTYTPFPTYPLHNNHIYNLNVVTGNNTGTDTYGNNLSTPSLLQDAFLEFHDFVPHHEFRIGQFKPPSGEESWRSSGSLDFVDRSLVGARNNVRDIGVMMQGAWFQTKADNLDTGRIQYWVGAFNGVGGTVLTDPELSEGGNRSDDNSQKDVGTRILVRPLWEDECWMGRLEFGYARTDGIRGKDGHPTTGAGGAGGTTFPNENGLNEYKNAITRQSAWGYYAPNGAAKGLWFRGEWGSSHDRLNNTNLLDLGSNAFIAPSVRLLVGTSTVPQGLFSQSNPQPISLSGFYAATGYKLSESRFSECLNHSALGKIARNFEFVGRFESFQNVVTERPSDPDRLSNRYSTQVYTGGVNYFIKGNDVKLQADYAVVIDPQNRALGLRDARNDQFVINFQVGF